MLASLSHHVRLGKQGHVQSLLAACMVPWGSVNVHAAQSLPGLGCSVTGPSETLVASTKGKSASLLCSHVSVVAMAQLAVHSSAPGIVQASLCEADCVAPPAGQLLDSVVLEGGNLAGGIDVLHCLPQAQLSKLQRWEMQNLSGHSHTDHKTW